MRTFTAFLAALLIAAVPASADQSLDALIKHVPDDAGLAVVVPSLDRAVNGVRAFADAIGIPDEDTREISAQSILEQAPGGADVWNATAPFVLAMVPDYDHPVILTQLEDPAAWREAIQVTEIEGGLVTFQHDGEEFFAALSGNIVMICPERYIVRAALTATGRFAGLYDRRAAALADKRHAVVYIDVESWREILDQGLQMGEGVMQMGMALSGGAGPATGVMMPFMFERLRDFVGEIEGNAVGINIGSGGLQLHSSLLLKPDGKLSKHLAGIGRPKTDLLRGLPDIPSGLIFGYEWKVPPKAESLFEQLFARVEATIDSSEIDDAAAARRAVAIVKEMSAAMAGADGAMLDTADGGLTMVGCYLTDRPGPILEAMLSFRDPALMSAYMDLWMPGAAIEVTGSQEKIAGTDVDVTTMRFSMDDPEMARAMAAMYGPAPTMFMAPTEPGVHYTFGDMKTGRQLCDLVLSGKGGELASSPAVQTALRDLPPYPQVLILVDPARLVKFGQSTAIDLGMPAPPMEMTLGEVRYAAAAIYLDPEAITTELRLPANTVEPVLEYFSSLEEAAEAETEEAEPPAEGQE